jgi:hypothetical protein
MINNPKIFTFWEPKEKIPAYIKLCMQTWKKFLPEYEIIIVDYSTLEKYLGKNFFDDILYKDFPLMLQADAIRCALLKKHGGIWIDADTIITSNEINNYLNISSKFVLIGYHVAFIKADKDCSILNSWIKLIKNRISFYKNNKNNLLYVIGKFIKKLQNFNFPGSNILFRNKLLYKLEKFLHTELFLRMKRWNYFGNDILRKVLVNNKNFFSIDRIKIKALPEEIYKDKINNPEENYRNFYFRNDYSKDVLNNTKGIILLHNSWTPEKYKKMSKEEFLNQNNTLSNILKTILAK